MDHGAPVVYGLWRIERISLGRDPALRITHGDSVIAECRTTEEALVVLSRGGVPVDQIARIADRFGMGDRGAE